MGNGKTTDMDGLGDSRHATPPAEIVALVGSTDYGSIPVLPSTIAGTGSILVSPMTTAVMESDGMDVVEQDAQVVISIDDDESTVDLPMVQDDGKNPEGSGLGDSQHATPDSEATTPNERLIINKEGCYLRLTEAGRDVQYLSSVIVEMGAVIQRLEKRIDTLEDDLDKSRRNETPATSVPAPTAPAPALVCPAITLKSERRAVAPLLAKPVSSAPVLVDRPSLVPAPAPVSKATWSQVASSGTEGGKFTLLTKRKG